MILVNVDLVILRRQIFVQNQNNWCSVHCNVSARPIHLCCFRSDMSNEMPYWAKNCVTFNEGRTLKELLRCQRSEIRLELLKAFEW